MAFIRDVLGAAGTLMQRPTFVLLGLGISIAASVAVSLSGWPGPHPTVPSYAGLLTVVLAILGRAWLLLSLAAVGLALLRGERASLRLQWVHVATALEVGVVSLALSVAVLAGTVALIVPGLYLLALWSQAALVIVDGQARFFRAANWSASLTDGYRLEILGLWTLVFVPFAVAEVVAAELPSLPGGLPGPVLTAIAWTWRGVAATFGAALAAALYLELSSRAPWQPELERVRPGADARVAAVMRAAHQANREASAPAAWGAAER